MMTRKTTDEILAGLREPMWKQGEQNMNWKLLDEIEQLYEYKKSAQEKIGDMALIIVLLGLLVVVLSVAVILVASGG